jgi:tRNA uridine 5-carboxymethylaminomethyl modification enzyme
MKTSEKIISSFNVIVIGAGHAGIEAAAASARMGVKTALITIATDNIGHMPCNPSIGGIGKGHIVFEIEALGGLMPQLADASYLQANILNTKKGPAVQGLRLQIDKEKYKKKAFSLVSKYPNLTLFYEKVIDFIFEDNKIKGLITDSGTTFITQAVVITSGTFLNGLIHVGLKKNPGGREQEKNVTEISKKLEEVGITFGRLKTGTPPRLEKSSINFSVMEEQRSHSLKTLFSYHTATPVTHKASCFLTATNKKTHHIILEHKDESPIFQNTIGGAAPRYCPSIEEKISRFEHKDSHTIFVEPESETSNEVYPNGISTSLPLEAQEKFIKTIRGFEKAKITKPGYAIEYDFVLPTQLTHSLELKKIKGLFFAGQINGTTGYEEAAGQGIVAGINAASHVLEKKPLILPRYESYIGLMIDDLVTFGVSEPYRMFTSRAERRLSLRQDNAVYRLYTYARDYDLIPEELFNAIKSDFSLAKELIKKLTPRQKEISRLFSQHKEDEITVIIRQAHQEKPLSQSVIKYVFAELLYLPYYQREQQEINKIKEFESLIIPQDFCYQELPGLSIELQKKLDTYRPRTIAEASLIEGMTPSALSLLIFRARELTSKN